VQKLRSTVADLESSRETFTQKTQYLSRQLEASKNRLEGLQKELAAKHEEIAKAEQENQTLNKRMASVAAERDQIKQTNMELENQLGEYRSRFQAASSDLADKDQKIAEMEKNHQSLLSRIDNQENEKQELQRLKNALKEQLGMTQSQIEALSMEAEAKEEQLKKKENQLKSMQAAYQELSKQLKHQIEQKEIELKDLEDKLNIRMLDKILFASGSAEITSDGRSVLKSLATELKKMDGFEIAVAGHTDNKLLRPKLQEVYTDNLGLSVARAAAVARALENMGVKPEHLSAVGYSMHHPLTANDSEEGRQQNRRVEIMLEPLR